MEQETNLAQRQNITRILSVLRIFMVMIFLLGIALCFFYVMAEQEKGRADAYLDFFTKLLFPIFVFSPIIALRFLSKEIKKQKNIKDRV